MFRGSRNEFARILYLLRLQHCREEGYKISQFYIEFYMAFLHFKMAYRPKRDLNIYLFFFLYALGSSLVTKPFVGKESLYWLSKGGLTHHLPVPRVANQNILESTPQNKVAMCTMAMALPGFNTGYSAQFPLFQRPPFIGSTCLGLTQAPARRQELKGVFFTQKSA